MSRRGFRMNLGAVAIGATLQEALRCPNAHCRKPRSRTVMMTRTGGLRAEDVNEHTHCPCDPLRDPDPRVVFFKRDAAGDPVIWVAETGKLQDGFVTLEHRIVRHSPTGMEFGYYGSGPADTALNVLILVLSEYEANQCYQEFKAAMIATIPQEAGGELSLAAVRQWLVGWRERNRPTAAEAAS